VDSHSHHFIQPALPLDPANDWTLRWQKGMHSWRHVSEGGFNRRNYEVREIASDTVARQFIETHHYTHAYVAAKLRYGLYTGPGFTDLVGVAVLSNPMNNRTLTNVFPHLVPLEESTELGRLILLSEIPANAESHMMARVWELAAKVGIRGVVSFSDPVPRMNLAGEIKFAGHVGTVYQALNAIKSGRSTPRTLTIFPDGTTFNERTRQKIRKQEDGADEAEKLLIRWGARPRRAGENSVSWLKEQMPQLHLRRLRHPGNHRYIFTIGTYRKYIAVNAVAQPYPKAVDPPRPTVSVSVPKR